MAGKYAGICLHHVKRLAVLQRSPFLAAFVQQHNSPRYCTTTGIAAPIPKPKKARVSVTFIKSGSEKVKGEGKEGDSLLDIVVNNNIDLDGYGACEGTLACSTCHLILKKQDFDKLPEKPSDEELDMLDLAYGLSDTSRLGCQIYMTKDLDGLEVEVPLGVNDARNTPV